MHRALCLGSSSLMGIETRAVSSSSSTPVGHFLLAPAHCSGFEFCFISGLRGFSLLALGSWEWL